MRAADPLKAKKISCCMLLTKGICFLCRRQYLLHFFLPQVIERSIRAGVAGRRRGGLPSQQRQVPDDQALWTPIRQHRRH